VQQWDAGQVLAVKECSQKAFSSALKEDSLTLQASKTVDELAQRHGVSSDAVTTLLRALKSGNGTMAQFSHPELGGMGVSLFVRLFGFPSQRISPTSIASSRSKVE
jgi:hypothetical protein